MQQPWHWMHFERLERIMISHGQNMLQLDDGINAGQKCSRIWTNGLFLETCSSCELDNYALSHSYSIAVSHTYSGNHHTVLSWILKWNYLSELARNLAACWLYTTYIRNVKYWYIIPSHFQIDEFCIPLGIVLSQSKTEHFPSVFSKNVASMISCRSTFFVLTVNAYNCQIGVFDHLHREAPKN